MHLFITNFSIVSNPGTEQQDTSFFGIVESKYIESANSIQ
jgi:hypothetical protein